MTSLYSYISSWFVNTPVEGEFCIVTNEVKIHTTSTPARNMPNIPRSQVVLLSAYDLQTILEAKRRLKHVVPNPRQSEYPPNNPLLLQLLEVTKPHRIE